MFGVKWNFSISDKNLIINFDHRPNRFSEVKRCQIFDIFSTVYCVLVYLDTVKRVFRLKVCMLAKPFATSSHTESPLNIMLMINNWIGWQVRSVKECTHRIGTIFTCHFFSNFLWFDFIQHIIKQYRYIAHIKNTNVFKIAIINTYSKTFKDNMPRITL